MLAFRKAFEELRPQLPATALVAHENALEALLQRGLPNRKTEDWRYTDISALGEKPYALAPSVAAADIVALPGTTALLLINGGAGPWAAAPTQDDVVTALNASFARAGLQLTVAKNQKLAEPVHVLTWCEGAQVMAHLRHRIRLEAGAEAVVILEHRGRGDYLTTQVTEIELAAGSRLTLYRVQDEATGSHHLARTEAHLARDAKLEVVTIDLGEGLARHDLNASLDEPGAEADLRGLYAPFGKAHIDNHTRVHHRAPHGSSREFFRGIAGDSARAVFNGKVVVHEGAVKTDSEQRVANLLLSNKAEINAKPELEIYNDDVKCAHGATFGQLDEDAVHYLRSRGLDRAAARSLLTWAFAQEIVNRIALPALRRQVATRLLQKLPGAATLGNLE